jgi:hypothetical protein
MLNLIIGAFIGAIVMDFAWAYKLGYAQRVWARIRGSK